MMAAPVKVESDKAYEAMAKRCSALRLPLWKCDAAGQVRCAPRDGGALGAWLRSALLRERVEAAARAALEAKDEHALVELYPGARAIPMVVKQGVRRVSVLLAGVFTPEAARGADFDAICAAAGESPAVCAAEVAAIARDADPGAIAHLATVLRWAHADLTRAAVDNRTLEQFSERLSQSYEEIHLLFRLARFLNCTSDPVAVIQSLCDQIKLVLPFPWLALRFSERAGGVKALDGRLLVAGQVPCEQPALLASIDTLLSEWTGDDWLRRLLPGKSELADAAGTEVLAEPVTHDGKVIGALLAGSHPGVGSPEMQFIEATADFIGIFHENLSRLAEQQALYMGTLRALTAAIDAKDRYTCGHSERVAHLTAQLAAAAGLDGHLVERYRIAGQVHDVGKIGVPEAVLCKPGRLTDEEFALVKRHPEIGYGIVKDIPGMEDVLPGVLHHHERYDGRGYPYGLKAQAIPLIARVMALADTFDAMSSNRSYRAALAREQVLAEITKCAGTQFDPELAAVFVKLDFAEFDRMLGAHKLAQEQVRASVATAA